jgi:hypothetical protein
MTASARVGAWIASMLSSAALIGCGGHRPALVGPRHWTLIHGAPTLVDAHGTVIRRIALACDGFLLDGRHHDCSAPRVHSIAVSPDGRSIAFSRTMSEGEEPIWDLGLVDVPGAHQHSILRPTHEGFGGASHLHWTADRQHLTYIYGQTRLEHIRIDGRDRRVLRADVPFRG